MDAFEREGNRLIAAGKVAALVVAGGQGTRLKLKGAKGLYPVSFSGKTLFQIFAEKIVACSKRAKRDLPLCIMTSPFNDDEIRIYFEKMDYFGLTKEKVFFFSQGLYPFKHMDGSAVYVEGKLLQGPDGNGSALERIKSSGVLESLKKEGIEIVTFTMIDNPLIDPYDARLIGYMVENQLDAALIAVKRLEGEKTGIIVEAPNGVKVIEYTEIEENQRSDLANISAFSFSVEFIERAALETLPLHAHKKEVMGDPSFYAMKYEKFIFDNLQFAIKCGALLYPREEVFAPLKNLTGPNSPETVKRALLQRDRQVYEKISGIKAPDHEFELDFSFYYPTEELLKKWKGRAL